MSTLNEYVECYKFDDHLKAICTDLFGPRFNPKINFYYKGCMFAKVRYIITYEDGYSFKLWQLFNRRCDLYIPSVKWYSQTGYNIVFLRDMLPIADSCFMGIFHEECGVQQKTDLYIVSEILRRSDVLVSMRLVRMQRDLYPSSSTRLYCLSDKGVMVPQ